MLDRRTLDIVIPAYNEAGRIAANLNEICSFLAGLGAVYSWRVIVVNDGSSDGTGSAVQSLAEQNPAITVVHHSENRGMGAALRTGLARSHADFVVTLDADLSYSPEHIGRLLEVLRSSGADIVLASAYMRGGRVANVPAVRRWLSRWANRYLSWAAGGDFRTATCVVRGYVGASLRSLTPESDGVEINLEILQQALRRGMKIVEVPAELRWRENGAGDRRRGLPVLSAVSLVLLTLGWGVRILHTRLTTRNRATKPARTETYDQRSCTY